LGAFPAPFSEWNDRYRNAIRRFWRGERGLVSEIATRLTGSSDIFPDRSPLASVNFITAHDGFTLEDLVSYSDKHNLANGENNQDGANENFSWNCGVEGPTGDPVIRELRQRMKRNLFATMLFSMGVPMISAGDEIGRTQGGNNNAYCQDNEISWLDWELGDDDSTFLHCVERVAALRASHPVFRRDSFYRGIRQFQPWKDITWLTAAGAEFTRRDWQDTNLSLLACAFSPDTGLARYYLAMNPASEPVDVVLPEPGGKKWTLLLDTFLPDGGAPREDATGNWRVRERSLLLLFQDQEQD
jgi:glycogen operon protein